MHSPALFEFPCFPHCGYMYIIGLYMHDVCSAPLINSFHATHIQAETLCKHIAPSTKSPYKILLLMGRMDEFMCPWLVKFVRLQCLWFVIMHSYTKLQMCKVHSCNEKYSTFAVAIIKKVAEPIQLHMCSFPCNS